MISKIIHRGPDSQNFYFDKNIHMGHARLRIIDLDKKSDQPMYDNSHGLILIFNGEIYNFQELKKELFEYNFKTQSDTEVIISCYLRWGDKCVEKLNGEFSFIIYDKKNKNIFGARDRFGIKPLFYFKDKNDNIFFSSEIKSLKNISAFEPNLNILSHYIMDENFEDSKETFFKNIFQIKPGYKFNIDITGMKLEKYYSITKSSNYLVNQNILNCIKDSIKLRLRSDVPIGLYYSGGVDSSILAYIIKYFTKKKFSSYTAVSDRVSVSEINKLKNLTKKLNLRNKLVKHEDIKKKDLEKTLISLSWHIETPFNPSVLIDEILNKTAKKNKLRVVLEGQGSDEIFAGYERYHFTNQVQKFHESKFKIKNLVFFLKYALKIFLNIDFIYNLKQKIKIFKYQKYFNFKINLKYLKKKEIFKEVKDHQIFDMNSKLLRVLRVKDRVSMKHSVELRVPFLDHNLVNMAFHLDNNKKISCNKRKIILKKNFENLIPKNIFKEKKNQMLKNKTKSKITDEMHTIIMNKIKNKSLKSNNLLNSNQIYNTKITDKNLLWKIGQLEFLYQNFQ